MTLYNFVKNAVTNGYVDWDYYGAYGYGNGDRTFDMIKNNPKTFIGNYFINGSKNLALNLTDNDINDPMALFSDYRAIHTVSAFFIGLFIEKSLNNERSLSIQLDGDQQAMPFSYLWFLACLYHDYGYCIEDQNNHVPNKKMFYLSGNNNKKQNFFCEYRRLYHVRNKYHIRHSIYSGYHTPFVRRTNPSFSDKVLNDITRQKQKVYFSNDAIIEEPRYSSGLVTRYFNYCLTELDRPVINHGIIGGQLFYDRMIKSYLTAYERSVAMHNNPNIDHRDFYCEDEDGNYKHFFVEQIPVFKHITDCIIAHNIWVADESSAAAYQRYGLNKLLPDNFDKISFNTNPMLFILAIADTIEPCKLFNGMIPDNMLWRVWKDCKISYNKKESTFIINLPNDKFDKLYKKAKSLELWVDVACQLGENQSIEIKVL